ncbi:immunity 21 family protein [Streptomyces avidinii]|nr:immunity 21 family protein [Streptomyces avidinii]
MSVGGGRLTSVVPVSAWAAWHGCTDSGLIAGDATAAADYDRACAVVDVLAGVIAVGGAGAHSAEAGAELNVEYPGGGGLPAQAPVPPPAGRWRVRAVHTEADEENRVGLVRLLSADS